MSESELRELDARVHREVMGLKCEHTTGDGGPLWFDGVTRQFDGEVWLTPIPRYSTDIAAAFAVLKRMTHGNIDFENVKSIGQVYFGSGQIVEFNGLDDLPRAICVAALASTGAPT